MFHMLKKVKAASKDIRQQAKAQSIFLPWPGKASEICLRHLLLPASTRILTGSECFKPSPLLVLFPVLSVQNPLDPQLNLSTVACADQITGLTDTEGPYPASIVVTMRILNTDRTSVSAKA